MNLRVCVMAIAVLAGGCAPRPFDDTGAVEETLEAGRPVQIQSGAKLFVLGVTDDDYAIFQEGASVYSTALYPGARRQFIANTGAAVGVNHPLVFASGTVAFIWPDSDFTGTMVSRLIVWSAATGPRLAAASSLGWRGAVAASPDSRQLVFIANASADGSVGDLVTATPDLRHPSTLVGGVNIAPSGSCPLLVGFDRKRSIQLESDDPLAREGRDRPAHPVAGYCLGTSTTATLSRWVGGQQHDLASDIHGFPLWSTDTTGSKLFTLVGHPRANQRPIAIDATDAVTKLEDVFTGGGSINSDDSIMTFAHPGANFEMHHFSGKPPRASLVTDMGPSFSIFFNSFPRFLQDYTAGFTSSAGLALFGNPTPDSNFNLFLVDTTSSPATPIPLQQDAACGPSFEPFSADSRHALVYCADATTTQALFDASASGAIRRLSSGSAEDGTNFAVAGSTITFADGFVHTPEDQDLSATIDIKRVDLDAATLAPVTLAGGAFSLYFPTGDREKIVYTSGPHSTAPGLFLQRVR